MVSIETWMAALQEKLKEAFGPRLLFLGLQGSYGRGEATGESDIDVVCVLDRVELSDLDAYRSIVSQMPEGEKACGFLCGEEELKSWPKYDLCSVARDTRAIYRELAPLLPPLGREDLAQGVAIGASGLYHAAVHTYLYAPEKRWAGFLKGAHKSAFFVLRDVYELRTGRQVRTKGELLPLLEGEERAILQYALTQGEDERTAFARLIAWSGGVMNQKFS